MDSGGPGTYTVTLTASNNVSDMAVTREITVQRTIDVTDANISQPSLIHPGDVVEMIVVTGAGSNATVTWLCSDSHQVSVPTFLRKGVSMSCTHYSMCPL